MAGMDERTIHDQINDLVAEEHQLRDRLAGGQPGSAAERARLTAIEVELDRLWDLLRQRQALRRAGDNPNKAQERPASTVEGYTG
jgi:predicted nuclease with TOPRIM domain